MTAEQEVELARRILAAERRAREAISVLPEVRPLLRVKGNGSERTRAGAVERLEQAVAQAEGRRGLSDAQRAAVQAARAALREAEQLRWELAMSAQQVARIEARRHACVLMDAEDLLQHGILGLLAAAGRFDPERSIRFATYARWWARAHMTRALENTGRTVRLPGGVVEQLRNLRRAQLALEKQGESPEVEDLAEEVGIPVRRARMLLRQGGTVSIEQELPSGGSVGETLESEAADAVPDEQLILQEGLDTLAAVFDDLLDEREKYILTHHYGLNEAHRRSMASIGQSIGISRERVRQIEVGALRRLREQMAS